MKTYYSIGNLDKKGICRSDKMNLLEQFINERMLAEKSARNYRSIIKEYEKYNNMTIDELVDEAEYEEDKGIRWKYRKLKTRLIGFRQYCSQRKGLSSSSVTTYVNSVKAFYSHFEIELNHLPRIGKQGFSYPDMQYEDLLTKEEIKSAYLHANEIIRAIILFMATSGMTKYDTCYNLTVGMFIEACKAYITSETLEDQLNELSQQENVVPTFYLERQKTRKWFHTFCSPEATTEIVNYLQARISKLQKKDKKLYYDDRLFNIHDNTLGQKFIFLNDYLNMGKCGAYRRFRCHMLRKFHASTLLNTKKFTEYEVDALQGRSKNKIHQAYFHNDVDVLKKQYIECIKDLTIINQNQKG